MKTVFLDSSVFFSAVNSPSGGSSKIFTLPKIKLITSLVVLAETEKNIRKKLFAHHLERFFILVDKITIYNQLPDDEKIKKAKKIIAEKDAVILSEAKQAQTSFLVTLDRKHFMTEEVSNFLKPQKALTPKELIELMEGK